jgi:hypothetical protein
VLFISVEQNWAFGWGDEDAAGSLRCVRSGRTHSALHARARGKMRLF